MNRIETQVRSARRRLIFARFGRTLSVTLFAAAVIAALGVASAAVWPIGTSMTTWTAVWIGGTLTAAVLVSLIDGFFHAPSVESVAAEVDRRFGLRQRLSSSLTLRDADREGAFGRALAADADRRADQLSIADRFGLKPTRIGLLPLAVAPLLALVVALVDPADPELSTAAQVDQNELEQVRIVASQLKKKIRQQRKKAQTDGLDEATDLFEKMESDLDRIAKSNKMDRKQAMIAINDLKKQLEERRNKLGSSEKMREVMSQLRGIESGPGEKVAKAMRQGEFRKAENAIRDLVKKMKDGSLSDAEKEQLKNQIKKMAEAMKKDAERRERKKQELKREIEKAKQEGRDQDAEKLQQKLDEMRQQDQQNKQMQQMAQALQQAAEAMENGDPSEATESMEQMAQELAEMADEMEELQDLESAMDQLSQSKEQIRCQSCQGMGCQACNGRFGEETGDGRGEGNGEGDRDEQEGDTNSYETQVRGKVTKGKAVIAGYAGGENKKGITREALQRSIEAALGQQGDPAENQVLPRDEREHTRQYFDRLRSGDPS